jgi:hypothetical protein
MAVAAIKTDPRLPVETQKQLTYLILRAKNERCGTRRSRKEALNAVARDLNFKSWSTLIDAAYADAGITRKEYAHG